MWTNNKNVIGECSAKKNTFKFRLFLFAFSFFYNSNGSDQSNVHYAEVDAWSFSERLSHNEKKK